MKPAEDVPCATCAGTGRVTLPAEIDAIEVYFFGCWKEAGHRWADPGNAFAEERAIEHRLPDELHHGRIDGGFCPGRVKGDPWKRTREEVEGEAKLTHIGGWTVLGWWDRSVDHRGACNSNVVVRGRHDTTVMLEIARRRVPHVIERQRQQIRVVETSPDQGDDGGLR